MKQAGVGEKELEEAALSWFLELGYEVNDARAIAPEQVGSERESYEDVVLTGRLREALYRLNPKAPEDAIDEAIKRVLRRDAPSLVLNNEAFHRQATHGIEVEVSEGGQVRGVHLRLFDFEKVDENDFLVLNQLEVVDRASGTGLPRRLDIAVFVNGLPLAVIELKSPKDPHADTWTAYQQLQTYKQDIPSLFAYNEVLVASDDVDARIGSLTAPRSRFLRWRTVEGEELAAASEQPLEVLIRGVFERERFLSLVRYFVVFEAERDRIIKKVAGYHQFHAVRTALAETRRAIGPKGDRKIGVVWHTQGSGKSLTMLFFAGQVVVDEALKNPTIVVLTDRNDLDDQLFGTFSRGEALLRQQPVQARDREHLKELLQTTSGGVCFTTIQKFLPPKGQTYPKLSDRRNIVVIADEAHRSQYGEAGVMNRKTGEIEYGYAKHLRDALPNASFIGFTGTPVEKEDADTRKVFGDHISIYDIQRAVEDQATVPILYESRLAKLDLDESLRPQIDPDFEELTEGQELEAREALKTKWAAIEKIVGDPKRLDVIAEDIVAHFEARCDAMQGKGLIVCMSRRICAELYEAIRRVRPGWHDDEDGAGAIKVVMSGSASDTGVLKPHIRGKKNRERMADRFKDPADPLRLVIVRDMWLTGFDVPCLHTMYVDKPMRGHNLMQAIARVNRVFGDKPGGLIVDYIGIAAFLKESLKTYTESGGKGDPAEQQQRAIELMLEKLEQCRDLMHGFNYSVFETGTAADRLKLLPAAREHVLAMRGLDKEGDKDGYDRFMTAVAELSKTFAMAMPSADAKAVLMEVAFFQAVRAGLTKLASGAARLRGPELDAAIRQIVSSALVAGEVVDVFDAAGIRRPDLSILSDEFLTEVRSMPHKNLAAAMLERLLRGELKQRKKVSVVQERSFADLLDSAVAKYKNRSIDSAKFIEELIDYAKQIREAQQRGEKLGLNREEFYFYEALAENGSARDVMGDPSLAIIATELTKIVRANATIDWTLKKNVQAKLRTLVKRVLKQHGYPPDQQLAAINLVLEQAKRFANVVTSEEAPVGLDSAPPPRSEHPAPDQGAPPSQPPPSQASPGQPPRSQRSITGSPAASLAPMGELPYPMAIFDSLVASQANVGERFRTRLHGFEKACALLVAAQLGLLRKLEGDLSNPAIRKVLRADVGKPISMGTWVKYVQAFAKLLPKDSEHPVARASRALVDAAGKRTDLLTAIQDDVVPLRNKHVHKTPVAEEALRSKEKWLTELWKKLETGLAPLGELTMMSRLELRSLEAGNRFRHRVRLHQGDKTLFPLRDDVVVDTAMQEEWAYLADEAGEALLLQPIFMCRYDDKSEKPELFVARVLGTYPGEKYELESMTTDATFKGKV